MDIEDTQIEIVPEEELQLMNRLIFNQTLTEALLNWRTE